MQKFINIINFKKTKVFMVFSINVSLKVKEKKCSKFVLII